ncbi:MAG: DUF997 family protein [Planctomycetota bacterium]|jgi:hypothetical protein
MTTGSTSSPEHGRLDPVLVHTRREAAWILGAFLVCLVWSVSWCWVAGYGAGETTAKVLGIPSWVFWGVVMPWLAADAFALWFCLFFIADDPLEEDNDEIDGEAAQSGPAAGSAAPAGEGRHD